MKILANKFLIKLRPLRNSQPGQIDVLLNL
jgi:hypothetical protein